MPGMSTHHHTHRPRESGSVIWFILLAIALTAALTMTLSRSSDTSSQSGDIERARVQASEIMRYAKGIEGAIDQMVMRGVGESQMSFENDFVSGYQNARCTDDSCRVFGTGGGGQTYSAPRREWLDANQDALGLYGEWYFAGDVCVVDVGTGGTDCASDGDSSSEDLVMILPWVKLELCNQINALLGLGSPPPVEAGGIWSAGNPYFTGNYVDGTDINQAGRVSACVEGSGGSQPADTYSFYHVLIDR